MPPAHAERREVVGETVAAAVEVAEGKRRVAGTQRRTVAEAVGGNRSSPRAISGSVTGNIVLEVEFDVNTERM